MPLPWWALSNWKPAPIRTEPPLIGMKPHPLSLYRLPRAVPPLWSPCWGGRRGLLVMLFLPAAKGVCICLPLSCGYWATTEKLPWEIWASLGMEGQAHAEGQLALVTYSEGLYCASSFFFKDVFIYLMYMSTQSLSSDTDSCEPPCGCWELNSGPLEEQSVLLTAAPSLQALRGTCASSCVGLPPPLGSMSMQQTDTLWPRESSIWPHSQGKPLLPFPDFFPQDSSSTISLSSSHHHASAIPGLVFSHRHYPESQGLPHCPSSPQFLLVAQPRSPALSESSSASMPTSHSPWDSTTHTALSPTLDSSTSCESQPFPRLPLRNKTDSVLPSPF
jgi:hypothetical protein